VGRSSWRQLLWSGALVLLAPGRQLGAQTGSVAITHATVIDVVAGRTSPDQTILIEGNRIRSVGPSRTTTTPSGARVIDATGKFVIPGLWDMHVHSTGPGVDKLFLPVLAANGITGVREMFGTFAWYDSARAMAARGALVSPRIVGAGHILDGKPAIWAPMSLGVSSAEEARKAVDSLAAGGAAFIKVYSRLTRDEFLAAADEAKKRGLPFAGHIPTLVSATEASNTGMKSVEHLTTLVVACSRDDERLRAEIEAAFASPKAWDSVAVLQRAQARTYASTFDPARCRALAETLKKNGTWMVPTITVLRSTGMLDDTTLAQDPRLAYIPKFFSTSWNPKSDFRFRALTPQDWAVRHAVFTEQLQIAKLLHEAGVSFLAGTDLSNPYIYPGFSLHEELANFVSIGFTPAEALRSATYDPARYFQSTDSLGTVAMGKVADLVVLDANPLADIRNTQKIFAVVLNGRLIAKNEREALLAEGRRLADSSGK
jgi:imidazolonepropionase-like amidohydrolase